MSISEGPARTTHTRNHQSTMRRRTRRGSAIAVLGLAAGLLAACSSSSSSSPAPAATGSTSAGGTSSASAASSGAVQVGLVILSGPIGDNEINMEQGFTLAEKDIASEKILGGRTISTNICEDNVEPSLGSACTRKLLNDGYKVMILDEASPEALADQAITERAGVIDILPSQRGVPAGDGKLAFSTGVSGSIEVSDVAPQIKSALKPKTVGLLAEDNDFGAAEDQEFKSYFAANGIQVTYNSTFATTATDFSSQLSNISAAHPDVLIMIGEANQGIAAVKQAKAMGLSSKIVLSSGMTSPALITGAGSALNGDYAWSTLPFPEGATGSQFYSEYDAAYHTTPPSAISGEAYTAMMTIARAMAAAKSTTDVSAIQSALNSITFPSPTGTVKFNSSGQNVGASTQLWTVENGKFVATPGQ
jgi:ABC-type branched-subunit amino acid transport system substrate-binding protein